MYKLQSRENGTPRKRYTKKTVHQENAQQQNGQQQNNERQKQGKLITWILIWSLICKENCHQKVIINMDVSVKIFKGLFSCKGLLVSQVWHFLKIFFLFKLVGQDKNYFPETIETLAKQGPVSYSFMFRETKKGRNCQP